MGIVVCEGAHYEDCRLCAGISVQCIRTE